MNYQIKNFPYTTSIDFQKGLVSMVFFNASKYLLHIILVQIHVYLPKRQKTNTQIYLYVKVSLFFVPSVYVKLLG